MRILVVDDERNIRNTFRLAIEAFGHDVEVASTAAAAIQLLKTTGGFDVAFLDLKLSQESGLDLLSDLLGLSPRLTVVMVTAYASIETAVEAMRRGAFDYLPKPCTPEQIRQVLARAEKTRRLENRVAELESRLSTEAPEIDLETRVARDAEGHRSGDARRVQRGDDPAAGGERHGQERDGAGDPPAEPAAGPRLRHGELPEPVPGAAGERTLRPCEGGLHRGAADTWGKVAAADGGTLFLDEIGDLPLEIQPRLLRLLQEREYERVGETRPRKANVRVISATNHDLKGAVAQGKFREDSFTGST